MPAQKYNRQELTVYALLWVMLFLTPVLGQYVASVQDADATFKWNDVFFVWRQFGLFFLVFLIHNFLLAPLLIERQRRWLYLTLVVVMLAAFMLVQCASRPVGGMHRHEMVEDTHMPPRHPNDNRDHFGDRGPFGNVEGAGPREPHEPREPRELPDRHFNDRPPLPIGQHDMVAFIVMVLMLGANLGVKSYYHQRADRQRLMLLEKQNLEQQLEYLRYQINPHFLMNTLNNIHALIDIDGERAKESIVQLSKIMRFVLYEGAKQLVPLSRELAFTQDYIELMRMRVTDRVAITVDMPQPTSDSQIPPLMLITFVENAFKHGVSYRQESFINIAVRVADGRLHFTCRNSKIPKTEENQGGVGLQNVRRRLDLIYGNDYSLTIADQADSYDVSLTIPLLTPNS